jgi:hypothetical protein
VPNLFFFVLPKRTQKKKKRKEDDNFFLTMPNFCFRFGGHLPVSAQVDAGGAATVSVETKPVKWWWCDPPPVHDDKSCTCQLNPTLREQLTELATRRLRESMRRSEKVAPAYSQGSRFNASLVRASLLEAVRDLGQHLVVGGNLEYGHPETLPPWAWIRPDFRVAGAQDSRDFPSFKALLASAFGTNWRGGLLHMPSDVVAAAVGHDAPASDDAFRAHCNLDLLNPKFSLFLSGLVALCDTTVKCVRGQQAGGDAAPLDMCVSWLYMVQRHAEEELVLLRDPTLPPCCKGALPDRIWPSLEFSFAGQSVFSAARDVYAKQFGTLGGERGKTEVFRVGEVVSWDK